MTITAGTHSQTPLLSLPSPLKGYLGHYQWVERESPFFQLHMDSCDYPITHVVCLLGHTGWFSHCCQSLTRTEKAVIKTANKGTSQREREVRFYLHPFVLEFWLHNTSKCQLNVYSNNAQKIRWYFKKMQKKCFQVIFLTSFSLGSFHSVTLN